MQHKCVRCESLEVRLAELQRENERLKQAAEDAHYDYLERMEKADL